MERVTVALADAPYDVVVGTGALADGGHAARRAPPGRGREPARRRRLPRARAHRRAAAGRRHHRPLPHRRGRGRQVARHRRRPVLAPRRVGPAARRRHRRARRRSGRRHRRLRRRRCTTAASRSCRRPTTLLAQVDAAIGGKTAVNLPEGKNLVGAFHQPLAVYADVAHARHAAAARVPRRARRGREVRAHAGRRARRHARRTSTPPRSSRATSTCSPSSSPRARRSRRTSSAADPQERTGLRATLNLGHTLAHALESVGGYELLHGEAVAVGLVFAGALAGALERIDGDAVAHYRNVVAALDLPDRGARARPIPTRCWRRCGATRSRSAASRSCCPGPLGPRDRPRPRRTRARRRVPRVGVAAGVGG